MSMQQAREGHFNPASPHSSSGAADSLKGTPDTRLTTFSPEDGSTRSAKALGSINVSAREAGPIEYGMKAPQSLERPGAFFRNTLSLDKDPFVSSGGSSFKAGQKLSPTASVFSPLPTISTTRGPISESAGTDALLEGPSQSYGQASGQSLASLSGPYTNYVHEKLSTETGVSRFLIISAGIGGRMIGIEVELYLSVRSCLPYPWRIKLTLYRSWPRSASHSREADTFMSATIRFSSALPTSVAPVLSTRTFL